MAEIFLSYQQQDRELVERIDDALSRLGFSVWWDDDVNPRENWDREIERELARARAVLVLWTRHSVDSEWVRLEAMEAKACRPSKLIQARFGDCKLPLAFRLIQYVDLDRDRPDQGRDWAKLLRWLRPEEKRDAPERPVEPKRECLSEPRRDVTLVPRSGSRLVLTALVMTLFALVVGYGWAFRLFAAATDPAAALMLTLLVAAAGLLLAWAIGRTILSGRDGKAHRSGIALYYIALFGVTAAGTLNVMLYHFEGRAILGAGIDDAEHHLAALDRAAAPVLRRAAPGSDKAEEVGMLLNELRNEITNPRYCGVGPAARQTIDRIAAILPEFREFSAGRLSRTCDEATLREVYGRYEVIALEMLDLDPDRRRWTALQISIVRPVAEARTRLRRAEAALASERPGSTIGYSVAQLALEDAAATYAVARRRLTAVDRSAISRIEPALDLSVARGLGSITAMPALLASRLSHVSSWIYLVLAAALDLVLVFLFVDGLRSPAPASVQDGRNEDLRFLWADEET